MEGINGKFEYWKSNKEKEQLEKVLAEKETPKDDTIEEDIRLHKLINKEKYDPEDMAELQKMIKEIEKKAEEVKEQMNTISQKSNKLNKEFNNIIATFGPIEKLDPLQKQRAMDIDESMSKLTQNQKPLLERHLYITGLQLTFLETLAKDYPVPTESIKIQEERLRLDTEKSQRKLEATKEHEKVMGKNIQENESKT